MINGDFRWFWSMWLQGMEPFKSSLEYLTLPHAGFPRRDLLVAKRNSVFPWRDFLSSLHLCFAQEPPASSSSSSSPPHQLPFLLWCLGCLSQLLKGCCMSERTARAEGYKSLAASPGSQVIDQGLSNLGTTVNLHVPISWKGIGKYLSALKISKICLLKCWH